MGGRLEAQRRRFRLLTMTRPILLTALVLLEATTSFGRIGETPEQFASFPASYVKDEHGGTTITWKGKTISHSGFFRNGRATAECLWFNDQHEMTGAEIGKFMQPYQNLRHTEWQDLTSNIRTVELRNRADETVYVVAYVLDTRQLSVWGREEWSKLRNPESAPAATPPPSPPATERKDCMLVATENLHRLASISYWHKILCFKQELDGVPVRGHAVAVWKLSAEGRVYTIDASGSVELPTTSEDPNIIASYLEVYYRQKGVNLKLPLAWFAE
jgi:hypothetical protein